MTSAGSGIIRPDPVALGKVLVEAAALARAHLVSGIRAKAAQDYVTDLDMALDTFLQDRLPTLAPGAQVLSEERPVPPGTDASRGYWIVDPLDGTGNAVAGLPLTAVAVAFIDLAGPAVSAVISIADGRLWTAVRGRGARINGQPLVLQDSPCELLVVSTGLLDRLAGPGAPPAIWPSLRRIGKIRNLGSQALHLCGVASGQFAAALSLEARIWDEAAAGLILREAGGIWSSVADHADWADPAGVMQCKPRLSLAAHPDLVAALEETLAGMTVPAP